MAGGIFHQAHGSRNPQEMAQTGGFEPAARPAWLIGLPCRRMTDRAFRLRPRVAIAALGLGIVLVLATGCHRSEEDPLTASAEQTFLTVCAKCHGADGKGGVPAQEGANPPRNFGDPSFQASRSDEDLKQAIRNGKGSMPAFGNLFSDADLLGLVHKVRSFEPASASKEH
jgi:mono/diheme cytochrome c family protein